MEIKRGNVKAQFDSYSQTYDATINAAIAFSGLKVDFFHKGKGAIPRSGIGGPFW